MRNASWLVVDCPDCDCRMSWKLLEDHKQPHGLHQVWLIPAIGSIEEMRRRTRFKWSEVKKQEVVVNDLDYDLVLLGAWHDDVVVSDSDQFFHGGSAKQKMFPLPKLMQFNSPRNECENRAATCESCGTWAPHIENCRRMWRKNVLRALDADLLAFRALNHNATPTCCCRKLSQAASFQVFRAALKYISKGGGLRFQLYTFERVWNHLKSISEHGSQISVRMF